MNPVAPVIGLLGRAADHVDVVRAAVDRGVDIMIWRPGDTTPLGDVVAKCHAVVVGPDAAHGGFRLLDIRPFQTLRLVVLPFAGHDWLPVERLPPGCMACNTYEHANSIAEYVLAAMLHLEIRLDLIDQRFRAGDWADWGAMGNVQHGELAGKRVGIVGFGRIGRGIAQRALSFEMEVVATSRSAKPAALELAWHGGPERLDELLETSDYVVLACDLNDGTRNLISAKRMIKLKPSAVLINVARSAVVDEQALFEALAQRRIRGAVIDVWTQYPSQDALSVRPSTLPFWELDNIVMTPHCSASTAGRETRRWQSVARALSDFFSGGTPANVFAVGPGRAEPDS